MFPYFGCSVHVSTSHPICFLNVVQHTTLLWSAHEALCHQSFLVFGYQMQQGVASAAGQDQYLMPLAAQHECGPEFTKQSK